MLHKYFFTIKDLQISSFSHLSIFFSFLYVIFLFPPCKFKTHRLLVHNTEVLVFLQNEPSSIYFDLRSWTDQDFTLITKVFLGPLHHDEVSFGS